MPVADLSQEQFEQVPDFLKDDYEQVGDVYRHRSEGKVATLKQSLDSLDVKLKAQQAEERAKIEAAKAEALENARNKGDVTAAEKLYKEQMADLAARSEAQMRDMQERMAKIANNAKADKKAAIVATLAAELATDNGKKTFSKLVDGRIDYDPETGKTIFLNEDGSASSLDFAGFKAEIQKSDLFAPVVKASVNQGGLSNGSLDTGGAHKKPEEMTEAERTELFRTNPARFNQLFPSS